MKNEQYIDIKIPTPGEILLKEFMEPLGLSVNKLALGLHASWKTVDSIVRDKRAISGEMGRRLSDYFGMSPSFWSDLQKFYDLEVSKSKINRDHVKRETVTAISGK
ncbi:MAG: HigA family addiction module antidote protein [Fusobacteriaceae bacterium]|jgi:addiction module HigA family antidote|nr:HigA family addiction module antidote protein [Fusobacteriaceae bacterium]